MKKFRKSILITSTCLLLFNIGNSNIYAKGNIEQPWYELEVNVDASLDTIIKDNPIKYDYRLYIGKYWIDLDEIVDNERLSKMNLNELSLLRNGIYAKHGYIFKNKEYQQFFSTQSWYQPKYANVSNKLSSQDIKAIRKYTLSENKFSKARSIEKNKIANETNTFEMNLYGDKIEINKGVSDDGLNDTPKEYKDYLINGIYAKHGYIFKNQKYANYFRGCEWYLPLHDNVDNLLTVEDHEKLTRYIKSRDKTEQIAKYYFNTKYGKYRINLTRSNALPERDKYTNITITDITSTPKEVFNAGKQGCAFSGEVLDDGKYFTQKDNNKDGNLDFCFVERGWASSLPHHLILSQIKGKFEVLLYDQIYGPTYLKVNKNGEIGFIASIFGGDYASYEEGFSAIYVLRNNKYIPSYTLTWKYKLSELKKIEKQLKTNPTIENIATAVRAYAAMGMKDKCTELQKKYASTILKHSGKDNTEHIVPDTESMLKLYTERWDWLRRNELSGNTLK